MARVTVVNDYQAFLDLMHDVLVTDAGHEMVGFDGDNTTMAEIVATRPDVLIIDLLETSDGLSGWDVLALARADDSLRDVPIIICSGDLEQLRRREDEFEQIGNIHIVEKPFEVDEMQEMVARLVEEREAPTRLEDYRARKDA